MSNTRHIDLEHLAAVLTGQRQTRRPVAPARSARPAFPRVAVERFNELLDAGARACSCPGDCEGGPECLDGEGGPLAQLRLRAMLPVHGMHVHGRPQAQATDGTATA